MILVFWYVEKEMNNSGTLFFSIIKIDIQKGIRRGKFCKQGQSLSRPLEARTTVWYLMWLPLLERAIGGGRAHVYYKD